MNMISISEDALFSIKAMTEKLQAERDDLLAALQRIVATDDYHATLHAPDGDDVARMIEYAEAFRNARQAIANAIK